MDKQVILYSTNLIIITYMYLLLVLSLFFLFTRNEIFFERNQNFKFDPKNVKALYHPLSISYATVELFLSEKKKPQCKAVNGSSAVLLCHLTSFYLKNSPFA